MSQWKWCATDDSGKVIKGWYQDSKGTWYHLNEDNGTMDTGWFKDRDGRWYYLADSGAMQTGWIQLKGIWYYLEPNSNGYMGSCYVDCTVTIGEKEYTFDKDGHMLDKSLVSDKLVDFVKSFEGFYANKYYDCVGVLTQGYGMTGDEIANLPDTITEETASSMLKEFINSKYASIIKEDLESKNVTLNQNEFDALVSFAYNCGTGGLLGSTLYKNVVSGIRDSATITTDFQAWSNGGGQRIEGLYRRRTKEANMFLNADYTGNE